MNLNCILKRVSKLGSKQNKVFYFDFDHFDNLTSNMDSLNNLNDINEKRSSASKSIEKEPPPKIDYKEEMILYFFNNMLDLVVDSWEGLGVIESLDSIPSGQNTFAESEEWNCSAHTDYDYLPDANVEEEEELSFIKSTEEIEKFHKKRSTIGKEHKKTKSRKNIIARMSENKVNNNINNEFVIKEEPIEKCDDSWMVESNSDHAVIKFKNGNLYEGAVLGKMMHGLGKFTWVNGAEYTGTFFRGEMTGEGRLSVPNGSYYEGGFLRGYRHGFGVMSLAKVGSIYHGHWRAGKKHGRGWQLYGPNNWYDGEWENDAMWGTGIRQYPSGARYHGSWKRGRRHGNGTAVIRNNDFYNGEWFRGQKSGHGEYIWNAFYNKAFCVPVQSSYIGSWDHNLRQGLGQMNFGTEGGSRYAGCFDNNDKHGAGFIICENGLTFEGRNLFCNDKPVHLKPSGTPVSMPSSEDIEVKDMMNSTLYGSSNSLVSHNIHSLAREHSIFKLVREKINLPVHFDDNILANIDLVELAFPVYQENFYSLCIPINTPDDMIVLNYYLKNVKEFFSGTSDGISKERLNSFRSSKIFDVSRICCPDSPKRRTFFSSERNSSTKEHSIDINHKCQIDLEDKYLRKAITTHLPKLRSIYSQYSRVACLKELSFNTLLIRLFLWQLYRDCRIIHRVSLAQIDELMAQNSDTELETTHSPFEIIYFWQFLHSLIATSFHLYSKECTEYASEGILKTSFVKLLEEDIYPNYGHHIGSMLFEYFDVVSIKNAYKWFQEYKEPFTVLDFLQCSCTIKKSDPPEVYKKTVMAENTILRCGINAYAIGHKITFLHDEKPNIQTIPISKQINIIDHEPYKKLFFLRKLGAKKVLSILSALCPQVKVDQDIVNLKYELTFYEFYEGVLLCIQELINRENEIRRLERERAEEEEKLQTTEIFNKSMRPSRTKRGSKKKHSLL